MNPHKPKKQATLPSERPTLSEWLAVKLDIPADALGGGLRLDLRGRNTLTVHGCTAILDFSPETIRLSLGECALEVCGQRLICTSYLAGAVGIEGLICAIRFLDGEVAP
jgi:sporulation protein YqfC